MSLKMATRQANGISIIDLSGQITLGDASAALRTDRRGRRTRSHRTIRHAGEDVPR